MTPEEFYQKMLTIAHDPAGDTQADHGNADKLMCEVLTELGYGEGVEVFKEMGKWYA